jgi:outer membrane protein insertion porin family
MLMNFLKISICWLLLTLPTLSKNFNEFLINGNVRISDASIKVFSEVNEGDFLDENSLNLILKNLYNTGFFKDVNIKLDNEKLIIDVIENPIIQSIFIKGLKAKKHKKLVRETLILKDRSSFNINSVRIDEESIVVALKKKGYFFTKVISSIENLNDNKINLTYSIDLGDKAKVSKISFIGDKIFKDSKLKSVIISEEYRFWKFISGKKFLNERLINIDTRLLNNFYRNKGYYNVKIESSFANYLGNNKFEIIHNITPNIKYYFNDMELILPTEYDESNFVELKNLFIELKGEPYSLNSINKILKQIDKVTLQEQYEFLSSTVTEKIDNNLINFIFNIEESEKLYVEKINIFGNNITREEVIRNNLSVDEGDAFNKLLHKKSINNIKSLNFFSQVDSEILQGSTQKQRILNISVDEKPTGEITAGAGVGSSGSTISFGVTENNFLGRGIEFGSDFTISEESVKGLISVINPNFQGSDRSVNFVLESTVTDRLVNYGYKSSKTGFSIGTGLEYYEDIYLNAGISAYIENLKTDSTATATVKKQKGSYFDTYFNYTLDYDERNQRYQTTDGFRSRFTQNVPIISENYTLKNTYDYKVFNEWLNENVASIGFFIGTANSITDKDVKLSDRLFIPQNKLRGFESGKVGPKDGSDFIGGNYAASINIASTLPQILPESQNTDFSIFFDAANVWGVDYSSTIANSSKIRSSVGIAVDFFTPIGPLNFSLSEVITKDTNDITESFRFNLGTTF